MSSSMMSTEPGGENSQYESINTVNKPHSKDGGQMGEQTIPVESVASEEQQARSERGEKTAENVRYGEAISEHGFGGETTGNDGEANQGSGYDLTDAQEETDDATTSREKQNYGPGSGLGA